MTARELYEAHHAALVPEAGGTTLPFVSWEALTPREQAGWEYAAGAVSGPGLTDAEIATHTYMAVEGPMFTVADVERILACRGVSSVQEGRHRLVSLPVDDLLMALSYEGSDPSEQDAAPAWKAARDRVLTAIYNPAGYTCPTACVEQNHPGHEHPLVARGVSSVQADDELESLRRWKTEAMTVMGGLQEVGQALGLPLGEQITGRAAVDAALDLRNRAEAVQADDDLRAAVERAMKAMGCNVDSDYPEGPCCAEPAACRGHGVVWYCTEHDWHEDGNAEGVCGYAAMVAGAALAASPAPTEDRECPSNTVCRGTCRRHTPLKPEHYAAAVRGVGSDVIERVRALADRYAEIADTYPGAVMRRSKAAADLRAALASSTPEEGER